jgi:pimeloyl-ACP methyl ester carboxylesterase
MRRLFLFSCLILCLLVCAFSASPQESHRNATLIDIGGYRLDAWIVGSGSPVIAIDSGLGEGYESWWPIARRLAGNATVVLYARAGYGRSDVGPFPRTATQAASELWRLLSAADLEGPYIIVGHSLGALHALMFAQLYPDATAGIIVIDPPPRKFLTGERFKELKRLADGQTSQFRSVADEQHRNGNIVQAGRFETLASENEMTFSGKSLGAYDIDAVKHTRVTAIASGISNPAFGDSARAFQDFWISSTETLALDFAKGRFVEATDSRHHVHVDDPDLVVDAIGDMIEEVSKNNELD